MEKAIIIARCSTSETKQDVTRQSQELQSKYAATYNIVKEFAYYKSGSKNDEVNIEILDYAVTNDVKHIIALEISRISRKISSFALFLEKCNSYKINIIIDNFKLHTLLPSGFPNAVVQTMFSLASVFATMEVGLIQERLSSGRAKYIKDGGKLGRHPGSKPKTDFLKNHADIIKYLRQGQSIRNTMALTNKSSGTIQKVKKALN